MTQEAYIPALIHRYLSLLSVRCKKREVELLLRSNPSYPSLDSISETLSFFGLNNGVYKCDYGALQYLPTPSVKMLAHMRNGGLVIIEKMDSKTVTVFDPSVSRKREIEKDVFIKQWSGTVLVPSGVNNAPPINTIMPYVDDYIWQNKNVLDILTLKRNPSVLFACLKNSAICDWSEKHGIGLGNPAAAMTITTAVRSQCKDCRNLVKIMLPLIEKYGSDIRWLVRFDDGSSSSGAVPAEFSSDTLFIYSRFRSGLEDIGGILRDWSEERLSVPEGWSPTPEDLDQYRSMIKEHRVSKIDHAPAILINDRLLPDQYSPQDIFYLIVDHENVSKVLKSLTTSLP